MSGRSNVRYWLEEHGIDASDDVVDAVLAHAKATNAMLTEAEILEVVAGVG